METETELEESRFSETWALDDDGNEIAGSGFRRVYAERCDSEGLFGRCIGVKGHEGLHWHYSEYGSYCSWVGDDVKLGEFDVAASMTPCGHNDYVVPSEREHEVHSRHDRFEEISESESDRESLSDDELNALKRYKEHRDKNG
jgi:hypothetical protein